MTSVPAVRCNDCRFAWNSPAMADGLRVLGCCPKCSGQLLFATDAPDAHERPGSPPAEDRFSGPRTAPHLVLGIPRR